MTPSTAHVLGGGLAGMAAAWELAKAGWKVVIYEKSERLGGKAGSDAKPTDTGEYIMDHGYHLFPEWYRNVRTLMGEAGISYRRITDPGDLFIGAARPVPTTSLEGNILEAENAGGVTLAQFAASVIVLAATPDEELMPLNVKCFLIGRFGETVAGQLAPSYEGLIFKALSGSVEELSALSLAKMFRRWIEEPGNLKKPAWSALIGNLQTTFIEPIQQALASLGCEINTGSGVSGLTFADGGIASFKVGKDLIEVAEGDVVVSALPADRLAAVLAASDGDPLPTALVEKVETIASHMEPMSAVDVVFNVKLRTPDQHFAFDGSEHSLTAYDISKVWPPDELPPGSGGSTVLQLIVARSGGLFDGLDPDAYDEALIAAVLGDLDTVMPGVDRVGVYPMSNVDAKLSIDWVGIHEFRPDPRPLGDGSNFWICGDWMDSSIGIASMEAAVGSGRSVGHAIANPGATVTLDPPTTADGWWSRYAPLARLVVRSIGRRGSRRPRLNDQSGS